MRVSGRGFSTQVELPCTLVCGPDALKLSGTALKIDPESMVLQLPGDLSLLPRVGDQVDLEIHLPAGSERSRGKDLAVRAKITKVSEATGGSRQFVLSFRKAHFKDRNGVVPRRKAAAATPKWEM
ncbi:MAG TPA: hypothetical protein VNX18_08195 [Bryobacteraceae bacterium]|nr:hypothetical protein [Bryobacteraceae bacterium]